MSRPPLHTKELIRYWRLQAEEFRTSAESKRHPETRAITERMALDCDTLADWYEQNLITYHNGAKCDGSKVDTTQHRERNTIFSV